MNSYLFLIGLSLVIILSFFANVLAKKTNIPSTLLLIIIGVGIHQLLQHFKINLELYKILEILGIVGLIMIVLEAALDLELSWSKWEIIWKSFTVASLLLAFTSLSFAFLIRSIVTDMSFLSSIIYAIPVSILSSAIIIPSVANLSQYKREFMIYESTFSDILGIMLFYLIIENMHIEGMGYLSFTIGGNILFTIGISIVLSYVLLYIIQNIKGDAKFFLFLAVLVLLYSIGKMFHLSSLIMILLFGLLLRNHKVFLLKRLEDWLQDDKIDAVFDEFKLITVETSFLVRTFFFVVFGMTLPLSELISWEVWFVSIFFLIISYLLRFLVFSLVERKNILPQVFIAPRGLISVLLFFAIPEELKNVNIENGVLFVVIIATSLIMAVALIFSSRKNTSLKRKLKDVLDFEALNK